MKEWIPVLQALIWPIFLLILLTAGRRWLREFLSIIWRRIETGSEVNIGPSGFSLGTAPLLDEVWVPKFTERVAKSILEKEQWINFISDPGDKDRQALLIKGLLEAYYKQIKINRDHLTNP